MDKIPLDVFPKSRLLSKLYQNNEAILRKNRLSGNVPGIFPQYSRNVEPICVLFDLRTCSGSHESKECLNRKKG